MKKVKTIAAACLCLVQAAILLNCSGCASAPPPESLPESAQLACIYADAALEQMHAQAAQSDEKYADTQAVIVPHYGNALSICCDLLASITRKIELVVILGPNHTGEGDAVQISCADWYWNAGEMSGDPAAAQILADASGGTIRDDYIAEDWSVQTLIPYAARYFPDATLATVLLARGTNPQALTGLSEALTALSQDREMLVIGSADFSHYLSPYEAQTNDQLTCSLIEQGDTAQILPLDNGYVDSPETVVAVLYYAQAMGLAMEKCDGIFEVFSENGQQKAGSYYTFAAYQKPEN